MTEDIISEMVESIEGYDKLRDDAGEELERELDRVIIKSVSLWRYYKNNEKRVIKHMITSLEFKLKLLKEKEERELKKVGLK